MKALFAALLRAKKNFRPLRKDSRNPHFGNDFASLNAVIDATSEPLHEAGLVLMQFPSQSSAGTPALTTILAHAESGDKLEYTYPLCTAKEDAQAYCGAITYARRAAMKAVLGLQDQDDDGNAASDPGPAKADGGFRVGFKR